MSYNSTRSQKRTAGNHRHLRICFLWMENDCKTPATVRYASEKKLAGVRQDCYLQKAFPRWRVRQIRRDTRLPESPAHTSPPREWSRDQGRDDILSHWLAAKP